MLRAILIGIAVSQTFVSTADELAEANPEQEGISGSRLERLDQVVERAIADGVFPGATTVVARNGRVVYRSILGTRGTEDSRSIPPDAIYRMYSSSKIVTAVAMMQLYEQGLFHLADPVAKYLPELAEPRVYRDGAEKPASRGPTMRELLTHTSGFSYGIDPSNAVDRGYIDAQLWLAKDLDAFVAKVAELPLLFEPGERWNYSVGMDLAGAIVERLSGQRFDQYLQEHLFGPLDMRDTGFVVERAKRGRLLPLQVLTPDGTIPLDPAAAAARGIPGGIFTFGCRALCDFDDVSLFSGGAGLVSTARDYLRFGAMLANGGELDGVRILGPLSIEFMASPHTDPTFLPPGASFGLGVGVLRDPLAAGELGSPGEFFHDGAGGTIFWIDREEGIVTLGLIQVMGALAWRRDLKVAVYQSIVRSQR